MSKVIRALLIGIAPIALLGLGAQVHAQANDVDCFHCVDTRDIAPKSVTSNKITAKAINTSKLDRQAVTKEKIAPGAVTSGKIRDGAVTVDKVAPELSNAIGTFCELGDVVVGKDESGNFMCEAPHTKIAYAWNDIISGTLNAPQEVSQSYRFNSAGDSIFVTRTATGSYTVDFGSLSLSDGSVTVSPYGGGTVDCGVGSWGGSRTFIRCYTIDGNPADSRFVVQFISMQ